MLDSTSQREDAAYHEAGHVVVGYLMGWWLNDEGAEIDRRQYTGLRCYTFQNDTRRSVIVKLAGWLAEHQFHKCGDAHQVTADGDAAFLLQEARDGVDDLHDGDLWEACQRVLERIPIEWNIA